MPYQGLVRYGAPNNQQQQQVLQATGNVYSSPHRPPRLAQQQCQHQHQIITPTSLAGASQGFDQTMTMSSYIVGDPIKQDEAIYACVPTEASQTFPTMEYYNKGGVFMTSDSHGSDEMPVFYQDRVGQKANVTASYSDSSQQHYGTNSFTGDDMPSQATQQQAEYHASTLYDYGMHHQQRLEDVSPAATSPPHHHHHHHHQQQHNRQQQQQQHYAMPMATACHPPPSPTPPPLPHHGPYDQAVYSSDPRAAVHYYFGGLSTPQTNDNYVQYQPQGVVEADQGGVSSAGTRVIHAQQKAAQLAYQQPSPAGANLDIHQNQTQEIYAPEPSQFVPSHPRLPESIPPTRLRQTRMPSPSIAMLAPQQQLTGTHPRTSQSGGLRLKITGNNSLDSQQSSLGCRSATSAVKIMYDEFSLDQMRQHNAESQHAQRSLFTPTQFTESANIEQSNTRPAIQNSINKSSQSQISTKTSPTTANEQLSTDNRIAACGPSATYIDMRSCMTLSQDWLDTICRHVIEHMNNFGICVIDNFLGSLRGEAILKEVLQLYTNRRYSKGRLVSDKLDGECLSLPNGASESSSTSNSGENNASSTSSKYGSQAGKQLHQAVNATGAIRNDRVIWVDGCEEGCTEINNLIQTLCSVITNSSRLSLYSDNSLDRIVINKRTKAHVACYPGNGTRYIKHVDNPNGDGRIITAIYYLNKDWDTKRDGGLLRMFPVGMDEVANIGPLFDRVLFFWSDRRNPHEVLPAYRDRFAITVWYIGESRPQ